MSKPSLQTIILGGFAYFVEAGLTVDAQVVSATVKPDNDPTTNWTGASLGDVLNFKTDSKELDISWKRANPSGYYEDVNEKIVTQDSILIETRQMNELVWRLQHGLAAVIAEGTAQTPGAKADRKIEGWLRLQGRAGNGYDRFILDWWCECRLESKNAFDEKVTTPTLRFTQIKAVSGTPVAGNSINFPTGS